MYITTSKTETRITTDGTNQNYPAISGDKIVWEDYRNGNWNIYMCNATTRRSRRG